MTSPGQHYDPIKWTDPVHDSGTVTSEAWEKIKGTLKYKKLLDEIRNNPEVVVKYNNGRYES